MENQKDNRKAAKIVALLNCKGGVGKTTSSLDLGAAMAALGKKVLLVDIDSQCSLTLSVGIRSKPEFTTYDIMKQDDTKEVKILTCPQDPRGNLKIIPCDLMLGLADLTLSGAIQREVILKRFLDRLRPLFDYILIDCPPALGIVNMNTLFASDILIVPIIPEPLAVQGLRVLQAGIDYLNKFDIKKVSIDGMLISRLDSRTALHKNLETGLRIEFGDKVFKTVIHENIDIAKASGCNKTIYQFNRNSIGAQDYFDFTQEFLKKYDNQ